MIQLKTTTLSKILNSKKDFLFFDLDNNNRIKNYVITNDYRNGKKAFQHFRVVSTIQKEYEFITIK